MREYPRPVIALAALGAALLMCAATAASAEEVASPLAHARAAAANGEELFGRNCQQCHNSRGKGGKAPQLVRGAWGPGGANSDDFMYRTIAGGRQGTQMGAFGGNLASEEIWQIVAFLREESRRVKATLAQQVDEDNNW
jgi:mono/diheme cytochrome c family protein